METIKILYINEVDVKIETEQSIMNEMSDYFKFRIPNFDIIRNMHRGRFYKFDGYIRLYDKRGSKLPFGLLGRLVDFAKERKYRLDIDEKITNKINDITRDDLLLWIGSLGLKLQPRDYQIDSLYKAIYSRKKVVVSPTSSGKSLLISLYIKWIHEHEKGKILVIVPTKSLVLQLKGDYESYGLKEPIHVIMGGYEKEGNERIYISTWQSLYELPKEYFEKFDGVIVDECHGLFVTPDTTKAISKILDNCVNASYRMGCTGTVHDEQIHHFKIESHLGKIYEPTSTKELMDRGILSKFKIRTLMIDYPDNIRIELEKLDWSKQQDFMENEDNPRQQLIIELAQNLEMNTLILFRKITHGTYIYEQLLANTKKEIFYVDGTVDALDREDIRKAMEKKKGIILVASFGTFSAGINIKNLHNVIFASSSKSKIRILQSIGRSLRLHNEKAVAVLYDIVDWFGYFKKHYENRLQFYVKEKFKYEEKHVQLAEWSKKKNIDFFN